MEILLDTEEQKILAQIVSEQDRFKAESLGRFAEPVLNRVHELAANSQPENSALLNLLDRLLADVSGDVAAKASVH